MAARDPRTQLRHAITAKARAVRYHHDNLDEIDKALADAKIEAYIQKVVDKAPPLTMEQRARLAALLLTPTGGGDV